MNFTEDTVSKPNISDQFKTRVEVVVINKNESQYVHEYFDATNNRGYVEQKSQSLRYFACYTVDSEWTVEKKLSFMTNVSFDPAILLETTNRGSQR